MITNEGIHITPQTVALLARSVAREMAISAPVVQRDYTVRDIATMTGSDVHEIGRNAERMVGHYRRGRLHFFDRATVDYTKGTGGNLYRGQDQ